MTTYTAAIATHDVLGAYCDVTVIKNDDEGDLTDEIAMATTELPVRTDDPDMLGQVETAAETALAQAGWQVYGPWRVADYALYADAEPRGTWTVTHVSGAPDPGKPRGHVF